MDSAAHVGLRQSFKIRDGVVRLVPLQLNLLANQESNTPIHRCGISAGTALKSSMIPDFGTEGGRVHSEPRLSACRLWQIQLASYPVEQQRPSSTAPSPKMTRIQGPSPLAPRWPDIRLTMYLECPTL